MLCSKLDGPSLARERSAALLGRPYPLRGKLRRFDFRVFSFRFHLFGGVVLPKGGAGTLGPRKALAEAEAPS